MCNVLRDQISPGVNFSFDGAAAANRFFNDDNDRAGVLDFVIRYLRVMPVSLVPISGDLCLIDYRFAVRFAIDPARPE